MAAKRKNKRGLPCPPPQQESARLYVRVAPSDIALFRFLLEAHDNLALFTVVDRARAVLLLRFSPDQERETLEFLDQARSEMHIALLPVPTASCPAP